MTGVYKKGAGLGVLLMMLAGCVFSPEAKRDRYLERGKKLLAHKDYARAILEFKNASQAVPTDAEVFHQMGLAYNALRDYRSSAAAFRRALELNPKHAGAQLRFAELLASTNEPDALKDAAQRLMNLLLENPQNPDALNALGLTELRLDEPSQAMQHLERALALAPQDLVYATTLAVAKLQQNDVKGAEEVLIKAAQTSKSSSAVVVLGRFYASQNRMSEAEEQFRLALTADPKSGEALLSLAGVQNYTGKKQEAEQNFKRLTALPNRNFKPLYGLFLFEEGRRDEAIREFERLAKEDPRDVEARTRLVAAYQAVNRIPDATKLLDEVLKKSAKDLSALLQRGELFLVTKDFSRAESDLNRVLHLKPDSAEAHYALARLHQARGNNLIYRQELNEVLRLNPLLLPVRIQLAQALMADKAAKAALALLDGAPAAQKNLAAILEQRNWASLMLGDAAAARQGVERGLAMQHTPDLLLQDAILKIAEKRYGEARAALKEALAKSPTDIRLLRALASSYAAQKQVHTAVQEMRAHAAAHPKSAEIQYFLGNLLLESGDRAQAQQAFAAAKAINPAYTPAEMELARMNLQHANWTDARQQLNGILSSAGENPLARLWLGMLEISAGNRVAAEASFRKVLEVQPNNASALNNLAYLLAERAPDEALQYAQKAQELDPGNVQIADTLGWVLYQKGVYGAAIKYLEIAIAKGPTAVGNYHLAMAYLKAGNKERGRTALEAALRLNPNLAEAKAAEKLFR